MRRAALLPAVALLLGVAACGDGQDDAVSACELLPRADAERIIGGPLKIDPATPTKEEQRTDYLYFGDIIPDAKRTRTVTVSEDAACRYVVGVGIDPATQQPYYEYVATYLLPLSADADLDGLYDKVGESLDLGATIDQREQPTRERVPELGERAERWISGDLVEYLVVGEGYGIDVTVSRLGNDVATGFVRELLAKLAAPPPGQS